MIPPLADRVALFKAFSRALFKRDVDALYQVVTPDFVWSYHDGIAVVKWLVGPAAISEHLAEQSTVFSSQSFFEVIYHQLPDMTFMTFRVSEILRATGEQREQRGIEAYTFRDGRVASKDVYRKPILI
jgi:ketosteroid isomerase-like protein